MQGESAKAWAAFVCYRDLGLGRSLTGAAKRLTKSKQSIWEWSKRFNWPDRALAWDNEQERVRVEAQQRGMAKVIEKAAAKREFSNQMILDEAANLAFSRITDVVNWEGIDGLTDSKDLPDNVAAAVESIQIERDPKTGEVIRHKIKFHGKVTPLDRLGQHKKLWGPKEDSGASVTNQLFLTLIQQLRQEDPAIEQYDDDRKRGRIE